MLVVTTDDLPGYEVRKVLGEVIGVTGRTRNPFREGVRKLHGGGNPQLVKALTRWRLEAVEDMIGHARKLGANAVLGMRFDHRNVSDMWTEICAYGTAVCVEQPAPVPAAVADPVAGGESSQVAPQPPAPAVPGGGEGSPDGEGSPGAGAGGQQPEPAEPATTDPAGARAPATQPAIPVPEPDPAASTPHTPADPAAPFAPPPPPPPPPPAGPGESAAG